MQNSDKLIYKDLSYEIVGILFDVYNELGPGYDEKSYEKAVAKGFEERGIKFIRQVPADLKYKGVKVGNFYLDFLIEDKIVLELKTGKRFSRRNFNQVVNYLKATNKKLAILATFTQKGVKFTRVLNIENKINKYSAEIKLGNIRKFIKF